MIKYFCKILSFWLMQNSSSSLIRFHDRMLQRITSQCRLKNCITQFSDSAVIDDDSKEMLSFLWILRSWLLECTAHGIPKVISSANFNRKIFWLVAVVVSSCVFLYQLTLMFQGRRSRLVTIFFKNLSHFSQLWKQTNQRLFSKICVSC